MPAEPPSALKLFQQREDRLFQTGYRLATSNAQFCDETRPAAGLLLHDAASYGNPTAVRREFGLAGDIAVQSVAFGSPAETAGLRRNDTIVAIGDRHLESSFPPSRPGWKRLSDLRTAMDQYLSTGSLQLSVTSLSGGITVTKLFGAPACVSRFELVDESRVAEADGARVMLGQNFPAFGYGEDEFAAAVAHELAHNILGHVRLLDQVGRRQSNIRLSERDADRLMPWLLANAGYDPLAAIRFMKLWGPKYGGGLLRKRTHDGWDERIEFIEAEIAEIEVKRDADGKADWRRHFQPLLSVPSDK